MSRTLVEAPLTTRAARAKLSPGIHWRGIDPDVHLGYRRGVRGGRWLVRWRSGGEPYRQQTLATADDILDADGVNNLSFAQAVSAARNYVGRFRINAAASSAGPEVTLKTIIDDYIADRDARERSQKDGKGLKLDCRSRMTRHVLRHEKFAATPLRELDARALIAWRRQLPSTMADATVRRLMNDLRAALNRAADYHRQSLPPEFEREVRAGLSMRERTTPAARDLQVLSDAEVRRVVAAAWTIDEGGGWDGALGRLVLLLAATGARFSQIARLTVKDIQPDRSRLLLPVSLKGQGAKSGRICVVPLGADVISALRPATEGRNGDDPLLLRPRWHQQSPTVWTKVDLQPWRSASEMLRPWSRIRNAAGLTSEVVPYALRHSSIVRGLRVGLPTRLVAAIHDTSVAMVESHYSAYVTSALEELSARVVIALNGLHNI